MGLCQADSEPTALRVDNHNGYFTLGPKTG